MPRTVGRAMAKDAQRHKEVCIGSLGINKTFTAKEMALTSDLMHKARGSDAFSNQQLTVLTRQHISTNFVRIATHTGSGLV